MTYCEYKILNPFKSQILVLGVEKVGKKFVVYHCYLFVILSIKQYILVGYI
jgi:hypothetical protein